MHIAGSDHHLRKLEKKRQHAEVIGAAAVVNPDSEMTNASLNEELADLPEARSRDASPVPVSTELLAIAASSASAKREVPLLDYIHHVMRFLQGLLSNPNHVEIFKGLSEGSFVDQLLVLFLLPCLPVNFNRSSAAEELRGVFAHLVEQQHDTILPISQAFQATLDRPEVASFIQSAFTARPEQIARFSETDECVRSLCTIERLAELFALAARESFHQGHVDDIAQLVLSGKDTFARLADVKRALLFTLKIATRLQVSIQGSPAEHSEHKKHGIVAPATIPVNQFQTMDIESVLPKAAHQDFLSLVATIGSVYRSVLAVITQFGRIFQRHTFESSKETEEMLNVIVSSFEQSLSIAKDHIQQSHDSTSQMLWADFLAATFAEMQAFLAPQAHGRPGLTATVPLPNIDLLDAFNKCHVFEVRVKLT